jgi:hypothetical protein
MHDLYTRAKRPRLRACWRVALYTSVHLERKVPERKRKIMLKAGGVSQMGGKGGKGNVHERMGKADFAAVDDAVADAFYEGKNVVVFRVEDDLFERRLEGV